MAIDMVKSARGTLGEEGVLEFPGLGIGLGKAVRIDLPNEAAEVAVFEVEREDVGREVLHPMHDE
jgi:hypothetical protein